MKIGEILEAIKTEELREIAKRIEGISEKPLRIALKKAGYEFSNKAPKGWHYTGEGAEPTDKSIFDYHTKTTATKKSKASNNNSVDTTNKTSNKTIKNNKDDAIIKIVKDDNGKEHDMKAEIQALIKGTSKEETNRVYKGIYFDQDIAHFLDNVKHGNKSEIVNMIMRQYLNENELL
jgi:hypothetical protein